MDNLQITCINKSDRMNPHERITRVGGGTLITPWRKSQQEAIGDIEAGRNRFYVSVGGRSVRVIVATSASGNKYIKTENDGEQPNKLLSLRPCSP